MIVYRVQPGHATLGPEVLAVGTRERGRHRDHEPNPVDRRDQAAAPHLRGRQASLPADQRGLRRGQGLGRT